MYTLRAPKQAELVTLGRHMSNLLNVRGIDMVDRRAVTALILGSVAGGSIPVVSGTREQRTMNYRQSVTAIKEWLGRINEGFTIDIDAAAMVAFNRYDMRCTIAYPRLPTVSLVPEGECTAEAAVFDRQYETLMNKYSSLQQGLPYEITSLLVNRGV